METQIKPNKETTYKASLTRGVKQLHSAQLNFCHFLFQHPAVSEK